jgi:dienelactone hydrolase
LVIASCIERIRFANVDAAVVYHGGDTEKYLDEVNGFDSPLLIHLAEEDDPLGLHLAWLDTSSYF